jgi:hypothetical protein
MLVAHMLKGKRFDPAGWRDYDARYALAAGTGLFAPVAVVNRFQARYRFARAFRGLVLEGYGDATAVGYAALTRVSLHWSAFEAMLEALRIAGPDIPALAAKYNYTDCLAVVRKADPGDRFFRFVRSHLSDGPEGARLRQQLDAYLAGEDCPSLPLAKAIRHIFFHGWLTPNAKEARPQDVDTICTRLSRSLVTIMDGEFGEHAADLKAAYP